jgi:SAM-dependent methyltransferase
MVYSRLANRFAKLTRKLSLMSSNKNFHLYRKGYCPICQESVEFYSEQAWLRDHFFCSSCGSIPRERALMVAIDQYCPNWRSLAVHESSPGGRGVSVKLHHNCATYTASQYYPDLTPGEHHASGFQCQNLEKMTFADSSFDLFVTQDVMEHIFNPKRAFREIARVLKPGGMHIFTVPIVNRFSASESRAVLDASTGQIEYLKEAEYHGNPVDAKGSLVTMDWGYDIQKVIMDAAAMPTTAILMDDLDMGIRAEYLDVLVSTKPGLRK